MVAIGYALSSEDHGPDELVRYAAAAEEVGLDRAWVSDHFHPWTTAQGSSPFVWTVLGGIASATRRLRVGTSVTCPTMRIHPAIVAHAAATSAALLERTAADGGQRFFLGVGTGENLNEHVLGDRWPPAGVRLDMLEEAVEVIRRLFSGDEVTHHGAHYTVENAKLHDLPSRPPPIYVSAFGPKALDLAARIGDGYIGVAPDSDLLDRFASKADTGAPKLAGTKCCWGPDDAAARRRVLERWPNMGLPGELGQELRTTAHFDQAAAVVTEEMVADGIPTGPDPEPYAAHLASFLEAGYDEVYLHDIGEDQEGFLRFLVDEVLPRLS